MQQKFTPVEIEDSFLYEPDNEGLITYPKAQTLIFIRQFACAYHSERELPPSLAAMILN